MQFYVALIGENGGIWTNLTPKDPEHNEIPGEMTELALPISPVGHYVVVHRQHRVKQIHVLLQAAL
jgi:hypothetical protein